MLQGEMKEQETVMQSYMKTEIPIKANTWTIMKTSIIGTMVRTPLFIF